MEVLIELFKEYGNIVLLGAVLFLWYEIKGVKNLIKTTDDKIEKHEEGCLRRDVEFANWRGRVETHIKSFLRRLSAIEKKSGLPTNGDVGEF